MSLTDPITKGRARPAFRAVASAFMAGAIVGVGMWFMATNTGALDELAQKEGGFLSQAGPPPVRSERDRVGASPGPGGECENGEARSEHAALRARLIALQDEMAEIHHALWDEPTTGEVMPPLSWSEVPTRLQPERLIPLYEQLATEIIEEGRLPDDQRNDAWDSVFLDCDAFPCILVHVDDQRVGNVLAAHLSTALELEDGRPGRSVRRGEGGAAVFLSALLDPRTASERELQSATARLEALSVSVAVGNGTGGL